MPNEFAGPIKFRWLNCHIDEKTIGSSGRMDGNMRKMPHTTFSGKKIARNFSKSMVMAGGGFH